MFSLLFDYIVFIFKAKYMACICWACDLLLFCNFFHSFFRFFVNLPDPRTAVSNSLQFVVDNRSQISFFTIVRLRWFRIIIIRLLFRSHFTDLMFLIINFSNHYSRRIHFRQIRRLRRPRKSHKIIIDKRINQIINKLIEFSWTKITEEK